MLALTSVALLTLGLVSVDVESAHAAAGHGLTKIAQLKNAPIPASCEHPATRLKGYQRQFGSHPAGSKGIAMLDVKQAVFLKLGSGTVKDAVVPMTCTAGGVSWPQLLLLYKPGPRLIGYVDLRKLATAQEHEDVTKLTAVKREVKVAWLGYEGAGSSFTTYKGTLKLARHRVVWSHTGPLTVEFVKGNQDPSSSDFGPGIYDGTYAILDPTPAAFVHFVKHRWRVAKHKCGGDGTIQVQRYSHKGFAVGVNNWYCGIGNYELWGRVKHKWTTLGSWGDEYNIPAVRCKDLSKLQRRGLTAVHGECVVSWGTANKPTKTRTLGKWPKSGQ